MKLHILGICGTFMGGLAALAREAGHEVEGSDAGVYPPMSEQLAALGIPLHEGYDAGVFDAVPGCVIVGNALARGNPAVEALLDRGLDYTSGAQWLAENVLRGRTVIAVAGTHGKTTTSAMLAWILDRAGLEPGFLIGGVPLDFPCSARTGRGPFVVEADEYDTAFFDKRAKFVHYRPQIAVLNNLEFDHADIYPDLAAIQTQFHHLIRTVPASGALLVHAPEAALDAVLARGVWTPVTRFGAAPECEWRVGLETPDGRTLTFHHHAMALGRLEWQHCGRHNAENALAALAAAAALGVDPKRAIAALASFRGVKRRLELVGEADGIRIYDDFAHHPTAIAATLEALSRATGGARIIAVVELASRTMRSGTHRDHLAPALAAARKVLFYTPRALDFDPGPVIERLSPRAMLYTAPDALLGALIEMVTSGDQVVFLSNAGAGAIAARLRAALAERNARQAV